MGLAYGVVCAIPFASVRSVIDGIFVTCGVGRRIATRKCFDPSRREGR